MLSANINRGATSTALISSSNPTVSGQPVTYTATVAPTSPATGSPTGSVTFAISGTVCDTTGDTVSLEWWFHFLHHLCGFVRTAQSVLGQRQLLR